MLFYGPPGTGKTSAILALAKDLFGPQMYRSRVLELNASDERGIDVVRHKIKHFASLAVSANKSATHSCPPFKLIILDEADCMTVDAQSALRRTMETYTKVTRFCILCNYVSRIIGPIASRCAKFRFQPMSKDVMTSRLSFISDKEGFTLPPDAAAALLRVSGGDLRRAITLLQNTYMLHGAEMSGKHITDSAAVIPDSVMLELVAACRSNSFDKMQVCLCLCRGVCAANVEMWCGARGGAPCRSCRVRVGPYANLRTDDPYGCSRSLEVDDLFGFFRISGSRVWSESRIGITAFESLPSIPISAFPSRVRNPYGLSIRRFASGTILMTRAAASASLAAARPRQQRRRTRAQSAVRHSILTAFPKTVPTEFVSPPPPPPPCISFKIHCRFVLMS